MLLQKMNYCIDIGGVTDAPPLFKDSMKKTITIISAAVSVYIFIIQFFACSSWQEAEISQAGFHAAASAGRTFETISFDLEEMRKEGKLEEFLDRAQELDIWLISQSIESRDLYYENGVTTMLLPDQADCPVLALSGVPQRFEAEDRTRAFTLPESGAYQISLLDEAFNTPAKQQICLQSFLEAENLSGAMMAAAVTNPDALPALKNQFDAWLLEDAGEGGFEVPESGGFPQALSFSLAALYAGVLLIVWYALLSGKEKELAVCHLSGLNPLQTLGKLFWQQLLTTFFTAPAALIVLWVVMVHGSSPMQNAFTLSLLPFVFWHALVCLGMVLFALSWIQYVHPSLKKNVHDGGNALLWTSSLAAVFCTLLAMPATAQGAQRMVQGIHDEIFLISNKEMLSGWIMDRAMQPGIGEEALSYERIHDYLADWDALLSQEKGVFEDFSLADAYLLYPDNPMGAPLVMAVPAFLQAQNIEYLSLSNGESIELESLSLPALLIPESLQESAMDFQAVRMYGQAPGVQTLIISDGLKLVPNLVTADRLPLLPFENQIIFLDRSFPDLYGSNTRFLKYEGEETTAGIEKLQREHHVEGNFVLTMNTGYYDETRQYVLIEMIRQLLLTGVGLIGMAAALNSALRLMLQRQRKELAVGILAGRSWIYRYRTWVIFCLLLLLLFLIAACLLHLSILTALWGTGILVLLMVCISSLQIRSTEKGRTIAMLKGDEL